MLLVVEPETHETLAISAVAMYKEKLSNENPYLPFRSAGAVVVLSGPRPAKERPSVNIREPPPHSSTLFRTY